MPETLRVVTRTRLRRFRTAALDRSKPARDALTDSIADTLTRLRLARRTRSSARRVAGQRKHILMVDDLVPDPLFGAGYPRAFAIVRSLVQAGHDVAYYPMRATRADISRATEMFDNMVRFHPGSGYRGLRRLLWTEGADFDALFISRPGPMRAFLETDWHAPGGATPPAIVYDAEAVLTPREAARRALLGEPWSEAESTAALDAELALARDADLVTAVSQRDGSFIASCLDLPIFVLPHPVVVEPGTSTFDERRDILFVGRLTGSAANSPNVDSVLWFITGVMPILDNLLGTGYRLHVIGRVDAPELDAVVHDRVVLHGVVEELAPVYDRCRLFVAPTRFAAGIPLKVVEAMGRGIPAVATPLLREQLSAVEEELPTGATPQAFAQQCHRLYIDPDAWQQVRAAGLAHVERSYSRAAFDAVLGDALAHVGTGPAQRPDPPRNR